MALFEKNGRGVGKDKIFLRQYIFPKQQILFNPNKSICLY